MIIFYSAFMVTFALNNCKIHAVPLQRIDLLQTLNNTRRILGGRDVSDTRPYMVYLRAAPPLSGAKPTVDDDWLCGGTIIHERYILTSAACIEDVQQFFVVSGTHRWNPSSVKDNECINNGAKKAVWKCVPKSYVFDGKEFENILWMANDIAVVKVEDDFNFKRRIRGCDFIPQKVAFNNVSEELEKPGTTGSIAGWGTTESFSTGSRSEAKSMNSPTLQEAEVILLSKRHCKKRWDPRYHHIIDESMICAKDGSDSNVMSEACSEQEVNCKELAYSDEDKDEEETRRRILDPSSLMVHDPKHFLVNDSRRSMGIGGFCENDHGGPLIVGQGKSARVIGVISACMTQEISKKCYGPFLYTSVWKNRFLISCAIDKEMGLTCRRLLRAGKTKLVETIFNWGTNTETTNKVQKPSESVKVQLRNKRMNKKVQRF